MRNDSGFTVVELLIVVTIIGLLALVSYPTLRTFRENLVVHKAAGLLVADITTARSQAIKRNENISLVADVGTQSYEIRSADGTVVGGRVFDSDNNLQLNYMAVTNAGDSLTFNSRGLLTSALGRIDLSNGEDTLGVIVNLVGTARIIEN